MGVLLDESVFRHEVSTITGLDDGDPVTSLTEQIDSAVTHTCSGATYIEDSEQGNAGIRFAGGSSSLAVFTAADLTSLYTATSSNTLTCITVCKNTGTGTSGTIFGAFTGNKGFRLVNSDARIGDAVLSQKIATVPIPNDELAVIITTYSDTYSLIGSLRRVWVNGSLAGSDTSAYQPLVSNVTDTAIGNISSGFSSFVGDYYASYVIDRAFTPQECMEVTKEIYDDLAIDYPWASAPYILAWLGDSLMAGVGAGTGDQNLTVAQQAVIPTQLNIDYGYWHNLGIGSIDYEQMLAIISTEAEWITSFYSKPVLFCTFEFHNQLGDATRSTRTRTYVSQLKDDENVYVILGTATDSSQYDAGEEATRQTYCSDMISDSGGADVVVSLHLNSDIGIDGSAEAGIGTFFSDSVHLTNSGYFVLADEEFVPAIQAFTVPSFISGSGGKLISIGMGIGIF